MYSTLLSCRCSKYVLVQVSTVQARSMAAAARVERVRTLAADVGHREQVRAAAPRAQLAVRGRARAAARRPLRALGAPRGKGPPSYRLSIEYRLTPQSQFVRVRAAIDRFSISSSSFVIKMQITPPSLRVSACRFSLNQCL